MQPEQLFVTGGQSFISGNHLVQPDFRIPRQSGLLQPVQRTLAGFMLPNLQKETFHIMLQRPALRQHHCMFSIGHYTGGGWLQSTLLWSRRHRCHQLTQHISILQPVQ